LGNTSLEICYQSLIGTELEGQNEKRRRKPAAFWSSALGADSGELDLAGLLAATAAVVLEHETDPVALVEGADACALEGGGVYEHVIAALLRLDEAEALGRVEEFHGACHSHWVVPSSPSKACKKPVIGSHASDPEISDCRERTASDGRAAIRKF